MFKKYDQNQQFLLPLRLESFIPEDHIARILNDVIESVDIIAIESTATVSANAIKAEINSSLDKAVYDNIISPINVLIDQLMYTSYVNYMQDQVDKAAGAILYGDDFDINEALTGMGDVLKSNGDALYGFIKPDNIATQIRNTGYDFISGIKWERTNSWICF